MADYKTLCATQVPSTGSLFHLPHSYVLHPTPAEMTLLPTQSQLPFLAGCFGLGSSSSQEPWGVLLRANTKLIPPENTMVKLTSYSPHESRSLERYQSSVSGNIFPILKERQGPAYHYGVQYQKTQLCIYVHLCNGKSAALTELVSAGVSRDEADLDRWFARLHSSLSGSC